MTPRPAGRLARAALAAVTAVLAAALTACGASPLIGTASPAGPAAATSSPTAATATAAPAPSASASAAGAAAPAGTTGGGRTAGGSGPGGAPAGSGGTTGGGNGGAAPGAPAPAIQSLRVVTQPSCPVHGTPDAPASSPGNPVTIAWSVTGAGGAALAVDNPDVYGAYGSSYPAKGQLELPFGCNAAGTTTHTYTVWPAGAKGTSKTITVSARANG